MKMQSDDNEVVLRYVGDGTQLPGVPTRDRRPLRHRFRAAVFDFDGLMVDSEPLWIAAERELLARHGVELTAADIEMTHGRAIEEMMLIYARRIPGADPRALAVELMAIMREGYAAGVPLRPGALALVRELSAHMPLAVASIEVRRCPMRSHTAPAIGLRMSDGAAMAKPMAPSQAGEPVMSKISQPAATRCSQIPWTWGS